MNFACIQDCTNCPFNRFDVSARVYQKLDNGIKNKEPVLPKGLQTEIKKETVNNDISVNDITEEKETMIINSESKISEITLPATQELQYTVNDEPEKKRLFRRKRK